MKCPKCPGKLNVKSLGGLQVDACCVCEGIWFDAYELEEVLKQDSPHFEHIRAQKGDYDGAETKAAGANFDNSRGRCPRCPDTTFLARQVAPQKQSVIVDVCPRGHGVWLDGGEILKFDRQSAGPVLELVRGLLSRLGK